MRQKSMVSTSGAEQTIRDVRRKTRKQYSAEEKIRTNNPLEPIMKEICRRTRVVGAFPDGQSCLNLAAARLRHIAGTQWSTRKYINMAPLYADQVQTAGAVA